MPVINQPVNLATFDQLGEEHCSRCKKPFLQKTALENVLPTNYWSLRVVYPSACAGRHFIHAKCLRADIVQRSYLNDVTCRICKSKIEAVAEVETFLNKYIDLEKAWDSIYELMHRLEVEVVDASIITQFGKALSDLKRFVDQSVVANQMYATAMDKFERVCVNKISELRDSGEFRVAIELTRGVSKYCLSEIDSLLEELWLYCCRELESLSQRISEKKVLEYYEEGDGVRRCYPKNREIRKCFKTVVVSAGRYLCNRPDSYEFSDSDIVCLKIARSNGFRQAGKLAAKILLEKFRGILANPNIVNLGAVNQAFVDLKYAKKYGSREVQCEVYAIEYSYFCPLGSRYDSMLGEVRNTIDSRILDPGQRVEVLSWLDLLRQYGSKRREKSVSQR